MRGVRAFGRVRWIAAATLALGMVRCTTGSTGGGNDAGNADGAATDAGGTDGAVTDAGSDAISDARSDSGSDAGADAGAPPERWDPPPTDVRGEFDLPPDGVIEDRYDVVGTLPTTLGWGEIELLAGHQAFRTEGYNHRTEKLRASDTFQDDQYPLRTYFGTLNQQIVDGFNLAYHAACATDGTTCPRPGPTRPEARYVLLHKGPRTAQGDCDHTRTPVLLVHGALQDANVWTLPNGDDGAGNTLGGATPHTGFVQYLESTGRCAYAVTFGNFHGDNYNQAIHVANAVARVREITGAPRVDVVAWSKGVLAVDAYLTAAPTWENFGSTYYERVSAAQAARVPHPRDDVRAYVALSGPHLGIDLNFRHPIHTLTVASTPSNAPVGRGPMPWGWFAAMQCVTWGPDSPWYNNPYASSVCQGRGGTWPDFFNRVYVSNISGLDGDGRPTSDSTLEALNTAEGAPASGFDFDEYNISLFGSVDDSGHWVSAYLGQLQATHDLRGTVPIPNRTASEWSMLDPDEARWFPWIETKLAYNPGSTLPAGVLLDDDHRGCRGTAFAPALSPCAVEHEYAFGPHGAPVTGTFYTRYEIMGGPGIDTAETLGGRFIDRLSEHGLDPRLPYVYVLYGDALSSASAAVFETDGMACPTCAPHGDGVLFEASIAALTQLTQGWSDAQRSAQSRQESVPLGHLDVGVDATVWGKITAVMDGVGR